MVWFSSVSGVGLRELVQMKPGATSSGNAREWGLMGLEEYLVTKTLAGKPPSKL